MCLCSKVFFCDIVLFSLEKPTKWIVLIIIAVVVVVPITLVAAGYVFYKRRKSEIF